VPKTLVRHLIAWIARSEESAAALSRTLEEILGTTITPELIPDGRGQASETNVGPYALQDFHLYYVLRFGYAPSKVAFLAWNAWGGSGGYRLAAIRKWLRVFLVRFFRNQFKRSALPNGPKVGSGGALSPRGDWRMPSDASAEAWLADLEGVPAND
jgi:NAD+ synthase (glutamine-hydrolysing)